MLDIFDIRINHIRKPKGIDGDITIGWKLKSDRQDVLQAGYELLITKEGNHQAVILNTGLMESENSVNIPLKNIAWESLRYYTLAVRVRDHYGEISPWRETRFLSALRPGEWCAEFITAEQPADRKSAPGTVVKTSFSIEKPVKEAFLISTAYGLYQAYLNGRRVGQDELTPGWTSYHHRLLCQSYDVTELLDEGENFVCAFLGAGWYKGDITWNRTHNYYGDYAAFAGQLVIRYQDGSEETVVTDEHWKGAYAPILHADIYDGETYDARREEIFSRENSGEWRPVRIVRQKPENLIPQQGCAVRVMDTLPVKRVFQTPEGDTILDFGQNLTGWICFSVEGKAGDEVELNCFETLDASGNVYAANLRTAKQTIRYICKGGGVETYQPRFTFQGFRYVRVKRYPGQINTDNFTARVLYSDMETVGSFRCSNPLLNQLQSNIQWGMKGNSVDVPTDCPQRDERLGWTGDAQVFCKTASFLMDTWTFYQKWLADLEADQRSDGAVSHVVPNVLDETSFGSSGWADVAVVMPWTLYQETGDPSMIYQQYESMKKWVDYVEAHNNHGIIKTDWQFGDWLALDAAEGSYFGATPVEYTSAAYHIYTSGLLTRMASAIGKDADAARYHTIHETAIADFRKNYLLPDGKLRVSTQTAYAMALYFRLLPAESISAAVNELLSLLCQSGGHLTTGFLGTPYLLHALSQNGCTTDAYDLLLKEDYPSWLYQVKQGATTVWEHWDGLKPDGSMWSADMNSFNHYAYGAVGQWLYEVCAGLRTDETSPGYRHFTVSPNMGGGLNFAEVFHESVYGTIQVRWERQDRQVTLFIQVPPNTTADIILNQAAGLIDSGGLAFMENPDGFTAKVGSGSWKIAYQMAT